MLANYGSLPFKNAVEYYRGKLRLPTAAWTDIWQGMHARAFVVAGAMRDELLADLQASVGSAIEQGTTLQQFRKEFDQIVNRHGWRYQGGRNWRTRVIYETNLRQAYNAGREKQMQDPRLRKFRPYGLYKHNDSVEHPRPEHLAWHNTVLPLDDPWWETHTPQNGWGCKCKKLMVGERDLKRLGLKVADQAPPIEWQQKIVGRRGPSPRVVQVPRGIDPGFAYNPGTAAWGRPLSDEAMASWKAQKGKAWDSLTPEGWQTHGRPERIPLAPGLKPGPPLTSQAEVIQALEKQLGGKSKLYTPGNLPVMVNAETLGHQIDPRRSEYLPLLDDLLTNPYEVWLSFERHRGTGQVALRSRLVKAYDLGKGRMLLMVANAHKGWLEGWTFLPTSDHNYVNRQRQGMLIMGKDGRSRRPASSDTNPSMDVE